MVFAPPRGVPAEWPALIAAASLPFTETFCRRLFMRFLAHTDRDAFPLPSATDLLLGLLVRHGSFTPHQISFSFGRNEAAGWLFDIFSHAPTFCDAESAPK